MTKIISMYRCICGCIYLYIHNREALKNSGFRDGLTFVESKISEELNDEKRKGKRTVFKKCQDRHW